MKILLVSNFLNHHQIPFCEAIRELCDEFYFIKTSPVQGEAFVVSTAADYVLDYCDLTQKDSIEALIKESECVIFGACPQNLIDIRDCSTKISFLYAERYLKRGLWRRFFSSVKNAIKSKTPNGMKVLCASAYLPYDLRLLDRRNDCYKWGYFPKVEIYEDVNKIFELKKKNSILWVGRFIGLKHPEYAVKMAKTLKDKGYDFELNFVGDGKLRGKLELMIKKMDLADRVHLVGKKTPDETRKIMEKSEIFLFTSNRREGWGAVLNEAMNSGCAVVASHIAGAVPFLIKDRKNGLIYKSGRVKDLTEKVEYLLSNRTTLKEFGEKAYQTLLYEYNSAVAAERLISYVKCKLNGEADLFNDGLMSKATVLKDNWYKG